jgi:energy-coupling factor transporter ATP-binding protein EcfA2
MLLLVLMRGLVTLGNISTEVAPRVSFGPFMSKFNWKQGEHVILIGSNGTGKTVLNKHLLRYRAKRKGYMCVFGTKPEDEELTDLIKSLHFMRVRDNNNWGPTQYPRLLLWPEAGDFQNLSRQRQVFLRALQGMWRRGKWTACLNELRYLTEHLKLKLEMNTLYLQARASKFSLTAETQRPRNVPLEAFSQSTHDFFAPCRDDEDLKRISGIGNADTKLIRNTVQSLDMFEFCYVNAKTGLVLVTKATPFNLAKTA